ncbi:MAG: DUF1800 family protein [Pseudomonadota bacterium]
MQLTVKTGLLALLWASAATLAGCSGGGGGSSDGGSAPPPVASPPPPPPAPPITEIDDRAEAVRFLNFATFGADETLINQLTASGSASDWVAGELAKPVTLYLPRVAALTPADDRGNENIFDDVVWQAMIGNDDQLRTRVTFALSQILVANTRQSGGVRPRRAAFYADALARNAFGNFRDLIDDVTYTPLMAEFLTYMRNRKGDERRGRMPDENYAREIMQLFTIGLVELNMDGTPRLDAQGQQIETYTNDDVVGLARVFTGLSERGGTFFNGHDIDSEYTPLIMYDDQHSELEKSFLGTTISAGTPGDESIDLALDALFAHPNVAPFISRQLIQRLTSSNPPPAYVERVATAFEQGRFTAADGRDFGTGARGDLAATVAAILLDAYVLEGPGTDQQAGKAREPVISFVHWARAFDVTGIDPDNEFWLNDTRSPTDRLGQQAFRPPSVFNFYRPGYIPPGSEAGARGMTVPEFQIVNSGASVGYLNFMTRFIFDDSPSRERNTSFTPDYRDERALADQPSALADHLNMLLTGGRMTQAALTDIAETVQAIPIDDNDPEEDLDRRVSAAVLIAINSPAFRIQR